MKVFVAGATGAIGAQLIPQLVARGHDVAGMTRWRYNRDAVRALGAQPVVADALDAEAVWHAVIDAEPEIVVHQATALRGEMNMRRVDRYFATTNRLRTEGTDNLLSAARDAGVRRFVAQSYAGWPFARTGGPVKSEDDPLDPDPPAALREPLEAIRHLEDAVTAIGWAEGIVLRYGTFYGPGTGISADPDATMTKPVLKRQFPLVGAAGGVWSFVHIADAADRDGRGHRTRRRRRLPGGRRRARPGERVAPGARAGIGRQIAAAAALVARAPRGRRGGDADDHRRPRRLQRQDQARARLAARHPSWRTGFEEAVARAA